MPKKRQKFRYVTNGCAVGANALSDFRLIAGNNLKPEFNGDTALRVRIPDDLKLEKWSSDTYSTTDDKRTLDELGYDVVVFSKTRNRWLVCNELKGIEPHEFYLHIRDMPKFHVPFGENRVIRKGRD